MNAKTDLVKLLSNFPNVSMAKDRKTFIDTVGLTKLTTKVDIEGNTISFFNGLIDVLIKSDGADGLLNFIDNVIACGWVGQDVIEKIEILKDEIENLDSEKWWEQFGVAVDKPIITGCPYRDLFPFREEDSRLFFGRESWNEILLNKVKSQSFVGVIGASGSGKSSLVFAGLIPQLRQEQNWQIVSFRPLFDPWISLAMAFVSVLEPQLSEIEREREIQEYTKLLKQSGKIRYFVGRILEKNHGDRLLLFIDQFEEFYRSGLDKKEREEFLDELFLALEPNPLEISSNCSIAITLRADFLGYALDTPHIGEELQRDDLKLTRMNPQELRDAIEKPAQLAGAWLQNGLTERILEAVEEKSGSLPLLQFALTQLWHEREDNRLTHAAYHRIGGLKKALPNYAEEIYGKLKSEQQKVKMVFLQLVHPRPEPEMEDTRRLATRDEVGEDNWDLAIRLASERLVVTGRDSATGEDTLEVVHEVLIQEWERLKQWIEEERQYIVLRLDIEARAKKWRDRDRAKDYVLKGKELREAKKFHKEQREIFPLSDLAVGFIQASVKQGWFGSLQIITITFSLAGFAVFQGWNAFIRSENIELQTRITNLEQLADTSLAQQLSAIAHGKKVRDFEYADLNNRVRAAHLLQQTLDFEQWKECKTLKGHLDRVRQVSFSRDGNLIASASWDNTVRLWKPDGTPVVTLKGHQDEVLHVSFSPKSNLIASASADKTVLLWELDGTRVATLKGHQDRVRHVSFSPDGKLIASASNDGNVRLWKSDGTPVTTLKGHEGPVTHVSFSPDGNLIASASFDNTVQLWKPDGTRVATLKEHQDSVNHVSFSPDGNTIASASDDAMVYLWQSDGTKVATLEGHQDPVTYVSFSPKSSLIASVSEDNTVLLWELDGTRVATLTEHQDTIYHVSFSPDGNTIASASGDKTVRLWQPDGTPIASLKGHQASVIYVSFSPRGNSIASASDDGTVRLWQPDGTPIASLKGHQGIVNHVSFSPDGNIIASASDDETVRLWQPDGTSITTLTGHQGIVNYVSFSPKGDPIASGSSWDVQLWESNGTSLATLKEQKGYHVSFSPDGNTIASASWDNTVRLWQPDGTPIATLKGHKDDVNRISFSPDGNIIASASSDNTVRLWQPDGTPIATLRGHQDSVNDVSFSPDGNIIASASDDETILLWELDGTLIATLIGHQNRVNHISFRRDGKLIASASWDGTVRLWEPDGTPIATLIGHQNRVNHISFSPDGKLLASASSDDTVRLWKPDGTAVTILEGHQSDVERVSFSPDGKLLASASSDGTVRLWNFDIDSLLIQGCDWVRDHLNTLPDDDKNKHLCDDIK